MAEIAWQFVACVLAADFITGVVHWVEDAYGAPTWPLVGAAVRANIHHHHEPADMAPTFLGRCGQTLIAAAALCLAAWLVGCLSWQVAVITLLAALGTEVHYWCHIRPRWAWVRILQDAGILTSPAAHAKHHREPFNRNYCNVTNLGNALLEPLEFWAWAEALVLFLFGIHTRRMTAEREFV